VTDGNYQGVERNGPHEVKVKAHFFVGLEIMSDPLKQNKLQQRSFS